MRVRLSWSASAALVAFALGCSNEPAAKKSLPSTAGTESKSEVKAALAGKYAVTVHVDGMT